MLANPSVYEFHGISGLDGDLNWIDAIMRSSLDMKSNIERAIREAARRSNTVNDHITMLSFGLIEHRKMPRIESIPHAFFSRNRVSKNQERCSRKRGTDDSHNSALSP